jgi:threonine/homoserine/homoserine lactone efflux protein
VSVTTVVAFALTCLALVLIPGPSVLFVVGRALSLGRTGGLLSVVGNAAGMVPHVLAVAGGVGVLVARSAAALSVLKVAGACYLMYLGVRALRRRREVAGPDAAGERAPRRVLAAGFLVGVTNPKTTVFLVAVLPQFASPDRGAVAGQLLVLGAVFVAIALVCDSVWALLAGTARAWLTGTPRRLVGVRTAGGVVTVGLGGALLLSSRA